MSVEAFYDLLMRGASLETAEESRALDFVIQLPDNMLLVVYANWSDSTDRTTRKKVGLYDGRIRDAGDGRWTLSEDAGVSVPYITEVDDASLASEVSKARDRMDFNRSGYIGDMLFLCTEYNALTPDYHYWLSLVRSRPERSYLDEQIKKREALREIGRFFLLDEDNKALDVAIIDEFDAASVHPESYMRVIRDQWRLWRETRPEKKMPEFVRFAHENMNPRYWAFSDYEITEAKGSLQDIAKASLELARRDK